jgi:peptidoglycan/xylan/chitin deacetylase (PgdA/CDA1 family)
MNHKPMHRLEILAFHRILADDEAYFIPPMSLAAETFKRLMQKLSRSFQIMELSEAVAHLNSDRLKRNMLALTFDDGYRDNHDIAKEFLLPAGIPATFFVPVNQIDSGKPFWWDYVKYISDRESTGFMKWVKAYFPSLQHLFLSQDITSLPIRKLVQYMNGQSHSSRLSFLQSLEKHFGLYEGPQLLMGWQDIQDLCANGFKIGSHTLSHEPLTDLDPDAARSEIMNSRSFLAERLGIPIQGFCYPRGAFSPSISKMVADAGYAYAVTTRYATNRKFADPFALSRRNIADYSGIRSLFPVTAIRMELTGLLDAILAARR